MNILKFMKNIWMACLLFLAQKTWAYLPDPSDGTLYGVLPYDAPDSVLEVILKLLAPLAFILVILSGIISPIIGYRWYVRHGGTKKWIGRIAIAPLLMTIVWLLVMIVNFILIN